MRNLGCVLAVCLLAACGGDSPGTGPVSPADAEAGCSAMCQRDIDCGNETDPLAVCTADCVADTGDWLRADAFEAITDCIAALACGASDDPCLEECVPTAAHTSYETACRERFAACVETPSQLDGLCEVTPSQASGDGENCLITPAIMSELTDCFAAGADCATMQNCLLAVAETHGLDF